MEILTGACDDMISVAKTRQLAQQLSRARLHVPIPGARHRVPTERYGRTAVTDTLSRMCQACLPVPLAVHAVLG
ncbi:hypothetical protein OG288_01415 [Streptomyces tauricus]|uniref:Alpha/beta hydrolase n=1 Tax=Streptomyces tauricus TaxID=68274 RepID=A0ABZ1J979_9ACTN|nr:hypothetical protein [Streptomyces tauricus]